MNPTDLTSQSKTERIWHQAGLSEFPELEPDVPYHEDRDRVRAQIEVLKGWTAWKLEEYRAAVAPFHCALDRENRDPELDVWMLSHLLERPSDYLQQRINGAWPPRSLRFHPSGSIMPEEETLPSRSQQQTYEETTVSALQLLHRLLLADAGAFRRAAPLYFTYHAFVEPITGMALAPIAAGSFMMGSPDTEPERFSDEGPQHRVTLTHDFWMGIHPVTRQEYEAITDHNPSHFKGPKRPVENVSWEDAVAFCGKLTQAALAMELVPEGYVFRLPTEAEWEYCCRAGTTTATAFGDSLGSEQANFDGRSPYGDAKKGQYLERTSDVGSFAPNGWGLYDMHGNVREWCLDAAEGTILETDTYVDGVVDPLCKVGRDRVYRGGSWNCYGRDCRSAFRYAYEPGTRNDYLGFRVCLARSPVGSEP